MTHRHHLERALELAERGRGTTRPNPVVGAVLVAPGGEVVGEGWHEHPGGPHAETVALEAAGERARGATLYVTLEPCAHHGRTPACADAVVAAGVDRILCAAGDPDPRTNGKGFQRLREAGIAVEMADGDLGRQARRQNEAFRTWVVGRRPFVTYKAAMTVDGRVAAASGDARWISGEESRRLVHELRAASDAVAVGAGTARRENPALTARGVGATRQPRRLAFGKGPLPEGSELEHLAGPLEDELRRLADEEVQSLLLEGGPTLAGAFLRAGFLDKLLLFIAPTVVGGDDAPPLFTGPGARTVAELTALHGLEVSRRGDDVVLTGYVHEP
ncbi:MAG: bifunctional diaminohydroxyphosphoribosylaminopyrimidine deaminase/5-amino-6-(5-phosphoribosylamino)uracil reductase RibD [Thermoleophilia bacterium]|nr:bifunctional diaminohydroxyphosphoribosylaminopyrimidine deaminase/5-amino-6-(5-phosphoribosylamino)uracil reductase RibD [Thermoleophilia bacterium]